jgi:non-lysosomal glucosylceramidase
MDEFVCTNSVYPREQLYSRRAQRAFRGDASEVAFLLGGIGTGNVSLGARGELRDWEIFNRPGKGNKLPYTFFAIWTEVRGKDPVARVLESRIMPPYSQSHGFRANEVAGLPRLDSSLLRGEYPFVWIDFADEILPVRVSLEAFTPFIPLNADDSGIPGAIIRYRVSNPSDRPVDVTVAGSIANPVGFTGYDVWRNLLLKAEQRNEYRKDGQIRGLHFFSPSLESERLTYGNLSLMSRADRITVKPQWLEGPWCDGIHDFWDDFCADGRLETEPHFEAVGSELRKREARPTPKVGSLGICATIAPGEESTFEFVLAWYFPNRVKDWDEDACCSEEKDCPTVRNYYAELFAGSWDAGAYLLENMQSLEEASRDFHRALFKSTLPDYVVEAVASNITVIRSTTCFRIEGGVFLGYEGCHDRKGCCFGNCTHVWNYAQTAAFLFPELERSMRRTEFLLETDGEGRMDFRTRRVLGQNRWGFLPAADGQMGTVVRLYREWKLSGDDELIRELWPGASRALDFAFDYWDEDGDSVLDGQQHVTYDIEFYGPNPLCSTMFLAALAAGSKMAEHLGDSVHAERYRKAFSEGSRRADELLWNGEYYIQPLEDVDRYRYQHGQGCLADQLFGQFLAHVTGLGYLLPEDHVRKAIHSVYRYNFRNDFSDHHNVQRTYVLNDEKGLLLSSWPRGGRPRIAFVYADEVWTGVEYSVAAHLIYEGFVDEGLTLVRAVRERHDGYRRNPWNEVECGHHYSRSLSSWAVLLALSGFNCDMVEGTVAFDPVINTDDFSTFWSTGRAWGIYTQKRDPNTNRLERKLEVLYGDSKAVRLVN